MDNLKKAVQIIKNSKNINVFTGAGISVESGVRPFRGTGGLWEEIDPDFVEINYFLSNPEKSWKVIKKVFYDNFYEIRPNRAHFAISELEKEGLVKNVITQNIDDLHYSAGTKNLLEFHGSLRRMLCTNCSKKYAIDQIGLMSTVPVCPKCCSVLRPDFVFFGEPIDHNIREKSFETAKKSDLLLVIGTTGEVVPASFLPYTAKENNAKIIEINIERSAYTDKITDIYLKGKATEIFDQLLNYL